MCSLTKHTSLKQVSFNLHPLIKTVGIPNTDANQNCKWDTIQTLGNFFMAVLEPNDCKLDVMKLFSPTACLQIALKACSGLRTTFILFSCS